MTEHCQRTQLELYGKVIAAYQQATLWRLLCKIFRHLFEKKKYLNLLSILVVSSSEMTFLFIFIVLEVIFYYINYDAHRHFFIFIISVFATYFIAFLSVVHVRKLSVDYLAINSTEYAALLTTCGRDWEFHRYLLFRHKLQHWKFRVEDVDEVRPLLDIEQQTLGSYVAQKPLTVWTYTTLGAILAASASNWPLKNVVVVTALGVFVLFILHISPMFITNQRRQYELRRFLAWYQADSLKLTATDFNRATPPPD